LDGLCEVDVRHVTIVPYEGVSGLPFGASRQQVLAIVGEPSDTAASGGRTFLRFQGFQVILDPNQRVSEVSLYPGECTAELGGRDVLTVGAEGPSLDLQFLFGLDPKPRLNVGFLVFFALGVWTTGFHDDDVSQRSFGAFARGTFDGMANAPTWSPG
jgi:hypothetical protein